MASYQAPGRGFIEAKKEFVTFKVSAGGESPDGHLDIRLTWGGK